MPSLIVNCDCVMDVLSAFSEQLPLSTTRRRPVRSIQVLRHHSLTKYSDSEKELAYRYLLDKKMLELRPPQKIPSMKNEKFSVPQPSANIILQKPTKNHHVIAVTPLGYKLLNLIDDPTTKKKLSVRSVFDTVVQLLEAGKTALEISTYVQKLLP